MSPNATGSPPGSPPSSRRLRLGVISSMSCPVLRRAGRPGGELGPEGVAVLADRRDRAHGRLPSRHGDRGQQGRGPGRRESPPRASGRVPPAAGARRTRHGAHAGAGDAHLVEALDDLVGGQRRRAPPRSITGSSASCATRPELRRSAGRRPASGRPSTSAQSAAHSRSFCTPMNTSARRRRGTARRARWRRGGRRCGAAARRRSRRRGTAGSSTRRARRACATSNAGAVAGALALVQRGQDAAVGVHAGGDVGDGDAGLGRRTRACRSPTAAPVSHWISRS